MDQHLVNLLKRGKVGVMPTDTIYGLVGSALNRKSVERIHQIKNRSENKPFIILIYSLDDLKIFGIQLNNKTDKFLQKIWPNPVSVVFQCFSKEFVYLHRGTNSLAFRIPQSPDLLKLLKQTGPLVAPSANPEGEPPAQTIEEAKKYFGETIDFYLDGGTLSGKSSTLIKLENNEIIILREGAYEISWIKNNN